MFRFVGFRGRTRENLRIGAQQTDCTRGLVISSSRVAWIVLKMLMPWFVKNPISAFGCLDMRPAMSWFL